MATLEPDPSLTPAISHEGIKLSCRPTGFPHPPPVPYFDHNATHPVSATARQAWLEALDRLPANPSSLHRLGTRSATALEEAREQLSAWLGCTADQVIWTSGATESNNAVLHHLAARISVVAVALYRGVVRTADIRCRRAAGRACRTGRSRPLVRCAWSRPSWTQRGWQVGTAPSSSGPSLRIARTRAAAIVRA